jgi:hypothetical protein
MGDPFEVDAAKALAALVLAWGSEYPQIWFREGTGWGAYHRDAADSDVIEADTPDELNAKIRADWSRRQGSP